MSKLRIYSLDVGHLTILCFNIVFVFVINIELVFVTFVGQRLLFVLELVFILHLMVAE